MGAGETGVVTPRFVGHRVYPRGCGGNLRRCTVTETLWGLSPWVRGKRCTCRTFARELGSIPVGAGETDQALLALDAVRVYPRGCGGNGRSAVPLRPKMGLSPWVRGKLPAPGLREASRGSIPVGAGETQRIQPACPGQRVYPRGCGGNPCWMNVSRMMAGLYPWVRRKRRHGQPRLLIAGSIPVGAGETAFPATQSNQ